MDRVAIRGSLRVVRSGPSSSKGFTLLELMIVVAVATVMLTIAAPAVGNFLLDSTRSAAVNELLGAIQRSRSEAIATRKEISVCAAVLNRNSRPACNAAAGWESGWLVFVDQDGDGAFEPPDDTALLQHGPLSSGTTLRGNSKIKRHVTFKVSGITANNGRIVFCDRRGWTNAARVIVVSVGGRMRVLSKSQDTKDPLPGCIP